jgi:hypothetical protein
MVPTPTRLLQPLAPHRRCFYFCESVVDDATLLPTSSCHPAGFDFAVRVNRHCDYRWHRRSLHLTRRQIRQVGGENDQCAVLNTS